MGAFPVCGHVICSSGSFAMVGTKYQACVDGVCRKDKRDDESTIGCADTGRFGGVRVDWGVLSDSRGLSCLDIRWRCHGYAPNTCDPLFWVGRPGADCLAFCGWKQGVQEIVNRRVFAQLQRRAIRKDCSPLVFVGPGFAGASVEGL